MGERYLPDGRRFYDKTEVDEMPDLEMPCPGCGKTWEEHLGAVEVLVIEGRTGFVLPRCPR